MLLLEVVQGKEEADIVHDTRWCDGAVGCQYTWDLLGGKATAASYSSSSNFCLASKEGSKKVSVSHMERIKAISGTVLSSSLLH